MKVNTIKCTAIEVKTESGICPGLARTQIGESTLIDGRTPDGKGICSNAFSALANQAYVMMVTDNLPGEKDGKMNRVCPHGMVVFSMERSTEGKNEPFNSKG